MRPEEWEAQPAVEQPPDCPHHGLDQVSFAKGWDEGHSTNVPRCLTITWLVFWCGGTSFVDRSPFHSLGEGG